MNQSQFKSTYLCFLKIQSIKLHQLQLMSCVKGCGKLLFQILQSYTWTLTKNAKSTASEKSEYIYQFEVITLQRTHDYIKKKSYCFSAPSSSPCYVLHVMDMMSRGKIQ